MVGLLWTLAVILFIFWLLGFLLWHLPGLIHLALIVAIVLVIVNLFTGRRAV